MFELQVISLKTQGSYFKKVEKSLQQELGDVKAHKLLSRAVYLISIGTNRKSSVLQPYVQEELVAMVIRNMTVAIKVSTFKYWNFNSIFFLPPSCLLVAYNLFLKWLRITKKKWGRKFGFWIWCRWVVYQAWERQWEAEVLAWMKQPS